MLLDHEDLISNFNAEIGGNLEPYYGWNSREELLDEICERHTHFCGEEGQ